jgi:hypothetical protein
MEASDFDLGVGVTIGAGSGEGSREGIKGEVKSEGRDVAGEGGGGAYATHQSILYSHIEVEAV